VTSNRKPNIETRQHLLIDADDTLWENNKYFENAISEFIDYLNHSTLTREEVRAVLDEIEIANAHTNGYGALSFARNLRLCYEHLAERHISEDDLNIVMSFGDRILRQHMEPIPGVEETLKELKKRHDLVLFTKGHPDEQQLKIDRSSLSDYFSRVVIVAEKNESSYRAVVLELEFDPSRTWMIGNSPKSDINPAIAAGLRAVYIPHEHTWRLEHQEVPNLPDKILILRRFADLLEHF
jgi:putative hydrolase of the HAD superfamily